MHEQKTYKNNKTRTSFKVFASTYNVKILNFFDPELQLKYTKSATKSKPKELLSQLNAFKFVTTLVLVLTKIQIQNKTKYDNFYSSSKAVTITIESEIKNVTRIIIAKADKDFANRIDFKEIKFPVKIRDVHKI